MESSSPAIGRAASNLSRMNSRIFNRRYPQAGGPGAGWPHWLLLVVSGIAIAIASSQAMAATVVVNNTNSAGQGFNSTTAVAPVTGNPATTLGAQRLNAFQAAADAWGAMLVSPVTIVVNAQMTSLSCSANSATLGSAGATGSYANFANAPVSNTWYAAALASSYAGTDLNGGSADISASFNQDIGTTDCLENAGWSYVIGASAPPGTISFFNTVTHELGHGLGFFTLTNKSTGVLAGGTADIYTRFLMDETPTPTLWTSLTNAGRAASAIDTGNLTWNGARVNEVAGLLTAGRHATSNRVRMYAPATLASGSSVSHFDTALSPNEIMEPSLTSVNFKRLANHLMLDIGWREMVALAVSNTDNKTNATAGTATSYTITLTHSGPGDITLVDAGVSDTLPAALTEATWTCSGSGNASCGTANGNGSIDTTVTVPLGGIITFTVEGTISAAFSGTLSNTVSVTFPTNIQNTQSSSATDQTTVVAGGPAGGVTVSSISGDTTEAGGTASFTVVLTTQPTANVTIGLSSSDTTEGTVLPASLVFTNGNWDTPQTVTVTGVDDFVDDGDVAYSIVTAAATSSDNAYNGINPANMAVTNLDNDTAGISVTPTSGLVTTEAGGTAQFTVTLNSQPTQNVTMGLSSSDTTEGTVLPVSLVFTSGNWNIGQQVTVTGADDFADDGDVAYTILTAVATSGDSNYNDLNAADVSVSNIDDDTAGITVTPTAGLITTETGGTAFFTVALNSQPSQNVTIGLSSNDTTEGTVAPSSLVFTNGNWNVPQAVTVTGVDDPDFDDDVAYSIITAAATSSDPAFNGINAADVAVVNEDDEGEVMFKTSFE